MAAGKRERAVIVAVFSDVHANLPALETFVRATKPVADAYVCLGDVVDYGPWNDECLQIVLSLPGIALLEGNHERLFLGTEPIERELPLVQEFYRHSRAHFSRRDWIADLPASYDLSAFRCVHTIDDRKIYADTEDIDVDRDYLIGHTHHAFQIRRSGRTIANCGSVGQNRAAIDTIDYALYDEDTGGLTLCRKPYAFDHFVSELIARGYPRRCVDYYLGKRGGTAP